MPVEESRRLHLYEAAREHLGSNAADTLMELLPPMDPSELATKADLALTRSDLRDELSELRSELRGEMAELRGEMADLKVELRTDIAELRTDLHRDMAQLQVNVADALRDQTNRILMFVLPTMLTAGGLSFAASQLAN